MEENKDIELERQQIIETYKKTLKNLFYNEFIRDNGVLQREKLDILILRYKLLNITLSEARDVLNKFVDTHTLAYWQPAHFIQIYEDYFRPRLR